MKKLLIQWAKQFLTHQGYGVIHHTQYQDDFEDHFRQLWSQVEPFTLTSAERGYGLYKALHYLINNQIQGDVVECGVYQGGSMFLAALTLMGLIPDSTKPDLWLYDTYEGMTPPSQWDKIQSTGQLVQDRWQEGWWKAPLEGVKRVMDQSNYPPEQLHFVQGDVAQTLKSQGPSQISLLRLDTDWYESTKIELEILYPRLSPGGVLIIDDYGHFTGARKAVDEYFHTLDIHKKTVPMLHRLDYTGRLAIKPHW
jgi:O-methyltransferase